VEDKNEGVGRIINSFEDDLSKKKYCFECNEEIQCRKKKKKCGDCEKLFHLDCTEEGMMSQNGDKVCLICYFERRKEDKNISNPLENGKYTLDRLSREYGNTTKFFLDKDRKVLGFELTEGDDIIIIPKMFRLFLKHYARVLPTGWNTQNLDLLLKMTEDIKASILDISFEIPHMRTKTEAENYITNGDLALFQVLKLRMVDANVNELRTKYNLMPIQNTGRGYYYKN
jgi:hypothetical protein